MTIDYIDTDGTTKRMLYIAANGGTNLTINMAEIEGAPELVRTRTHLTTQYPITETAIASNTNLAKLCADPKRLAGATVQFHTEESWDEGMDGNWWMCGTMDYYVTTDGTQFWESYEEAVEHQLRWLLSTEDVLIDDE
jgi:hypothetical protein